VHSAWSSAKHLKKAGENHGLAGKKEDPWNQEGAQAGKKQRREKISKSGKPKA
jgi:hypothetical protein